MSSELAEAHGLFAADRLDEAAILCRTALAHDVGDMAALRLLGVILLRQGAAAEAVPLLASVADAQPDAAVQHELGEALRATGQTEEAEARFRTATTSQPDYPDPWLSLGNILLERDELSAAEHCFRSAIAARPDFVEALNNLGNALVAQHRLAEARQCYCTALKLRPDSANTGFAYALALLLDGDFAQGWKHFEARRNVGPLRWNYERRPELPQWQPGVELDGRRVLLMAEQGAGDIIQFVRYVLLLAARGAHIVLELPAALQPLFRQLPGVTRIVDLTEPVPDCDIACPLLSLPLYFATTLATIPAAVPYAGIPPERVARWREWLGPARGRRIALVCSGRPEHPLDRHRSIALDRIATLLAVPGCEFILLQQQLRERDAACIAATPELRWPGTLLQDFADTAALLAECDLLISVDTSVAHLAGALARPVWLLLPFAPDFRWLLGRSDTPWYPTLRLYRQPAQSDWDAVLAAVRRDLDERR